MTEETESDPIPVASRVVAALLGLVAAAASSWLLGAWVLELLGAGGVSNIVAVVVAAVVALVVPGVLGFLVGRAAGRQKIVTGPTGALLWAVVVTNIAVLAGFVLLAPDGSRKALETHGAWPAALAGSDAEGSAGLQARADAVAGLIPGSGSPGEKMLSTDAGAGAADVAGATAADTSAVDAADGLGSDANAATGDAASDAAADSSETIPDSPMTPKDLFETRAKTVVVVATRTEVDEDSVLGKLMTKIGQTIIDGHGSGFVVGDGGLIVTNYHVVDGAKSAVVKFKDGTELSPVEILATDETNDLALIRVAAPGKLPVAPLAGPEDGAVGEQVLAIGAPLGLDFTLTTGPISALRDQQDTRVIQTQATIAPGSSGGPLFDMRGRVLGVTTATRGPGLNLAVHVSHVEALLAAPRTPKALPVYQPGLKILDLTTEGDDVKPTTRAQLENAVKLLAGAVKGCLKDQPHPADASLKLHFKKVEVFARKPKLTSNLGKNVEKCMREPIEFSGLFIMAPFASVSKKKPKPHVVATAKLDGFDANHDGNADFILTIEIGKAPPGEAKPKPGKTDAAPE